MVIKAILKNECDNYLHEFLILWKEHASFVKEIQTERSSYYVLLLSLKNDRELEVNVKNAPDTFEGFYQVKASAVCLYDGLRFGLYPARASAMEKKSSDVTNFWKEVQKSDEEKNAIRSASLGHLNIFGKTLTQYANEQEGLIENISTNYHPRASAVCSCYDLQFRVISVMAFTKLRFGLYPARASVMEKKFSDVTNFWKEVQKSDEEENAIRSTPLGHSTYLKRRASAVCSCYDLQFRVISVMAFTKLRFGLYPARASVMEKKFSDVTNFWKEVQKSDEEENAIRSTPLGHSTYLKRRCTNVQYCLLYNILCLIREVVAYINVLQILWYSRGSKTRPDLSCTVNDVPILNSEFKLLGYTSLQKIESRILAIDQWNLPFLATKLVVDKATIPLAKFAISHLMALEERVEKIVKDFKYRSSQFTPPVQMSYIRKFPDTPQVKMLLK
ncbi:hypothetical protein Glove_505g39 [Diversispora epigaea]|uniref:Uncharacterized protein n=1 Tax=Diversispora epigaea TaxID=1348612 RepID=A0A397GHX4_9GLOM|nr:hypothetical protein Glove_505g39 [Diversispora epigaea]